MTAVRLTGKRTLLFVSSTNSRKLADIQGNKGGCLTFAGDGWWACVTGEFSIRALSDSEIAAFACDWETPGEEVVGLEFAVRAVEAWGAVGGPRELGLDPAASTEENSENIRRIR